MASVVRSHDAFDAVEQAIPPQVPATHTPQAVRVPAGVRVERSFAGYGIGNEIRALCDNATIF